MGKPVKDYWRLFDPSYELCNGFPLGSAISFADTYFTVSEGHASLKIARALHEVSAHAKAVAHGGLAEGYPLMLSTSVGDQVILDLAMPPILAGLEPSVMGLAIINPDGTIRKTWGLAQVTPPLRTHESLLEGPLANIVAAALRGESGALYLDGYRYAGGGGSVAGASFLVVINAQEERQARRQADRSWRAAQTLQRFSKEVTTNPTVKPLCVMAVREIASSTELAAALLWLKSEEGPDLELYAHVGVTRQGVKALTLLNTENPGGCAAELVASTQIPLGYPNVYENMITQNLEGLFCYLQPRAVLILPLVIGGRLVGVLELVGREDDQNFEENRELFQTLAEHLALAVNSARMYETFERLASFDALTGLANHRAMQEFLHARLSESDRNGQSLGVVIADVDHFRSFNEEEGHDVGDQVLRQVGQAIKSVLRPYDLAARYGGEEFVVILPNGGGESLLLSAERIRHQVESIEIELAGGRKRNVTISLGCATYPGSAQDSSTLWKAADYALYQSKRNGRNRVTVYEGQYVGEEKSTAIDLEVLGAWMDEVGQAEARNRLERLQSEARRFAETVGLSASQLDILKGLIFAVSLHTRSLQDPDLRKRMERSEEFRVLLPHLDGARERFDGQGGERAGTRIPLLARVLAVLLAHDEGRSLDIESGQFDPEIVTLLIDAPHAA